MKGLAGVVILYHPDNKIHQRIDSYVNFVERLYVFDNSESHLCPPISSSKIVWYADGTNQGIAARLNQAAHQALKDGYSWLLTMDQDSVFTERNISSYTNCIENYPEANKVSMFGIEFLKKNGSDNGCTFIETTRLITSGSIINLQAYEEIGMFDEGLFIDQVDFDYCYKSILKGYKIIQFTNIYLEHSLGKTSVHTSLKSLSKTTRSLHPPIRLYYMTRNFLYMRSKYKKALPEEIAHIKRDLLNRIKNNLLYGNARWAVVKSILAAIRDYRRKKMGKKQQA